MTDAKVYFVDTNILVYAFEKEISEKKIRAEKILTECWKNERILAVSNQVLAEFSYVMLMRGKLSLEEIETILSKVIRFKGFAKEEYGSQTITSALYLLKSSNIPFWDALIAATMLENSIRDIYTENTKDFAVQGINAINPFIHKRKSRGKTSDPAKN